MCEATIKTLTVYIVKVSNFKRKKMAIAIQNALTQRASSLDTVQMVCFKHQVTPLIYLANPSVLVLDVNQKSNTIISLARICITSVRKMCVLLCPSCAINFKIIFLNKI